MFFVDLSMKIVSSIRGRSVSASQMYHLYIHHSRNSRRIYDNVFFNSKCAQSVSLFFGLFFSFHLNASMCDILSSGRRRRGGWPSLWCDAHLKCRHQSFSCFSSDCIYIRRVFFKQATTLIAVLLFLPNGWF
jgi:hypothetical protein